MDGCTRLLGLLFAVCFAAVFSPACMAARGPRAADVKKMTEAAPSKPYVKPAKPRKMLIFSVCNGFRHSSIPFGAKALEIVGEKTGAYEAVVSDDLKNFEPENIKKFDVICFNNTTRELFTPKNVNKLPAAEKAEALARDARLKKSLMDWVRAGGGVVGVHAATDTFYKWPEYGKMMGGYFSGHPWNEKVYLKNDDPDHPVNQAFGGKGFEVADEIYQFKDPYSREALHVLLSLDTAKCNMKKGGIRRKDKDFAVSWVRSWGKGRVFYCSLGHRNDIFWNPVVLRHYLAGIQFAAGDLKADTTPSAAGKAAAKPTQAAADGFKNMFNLKDTTGWICKPGSWVFEGDALARKGGGSIWSKDTYGDFILDLEFKVAKGTNSGVFIRTASIKQWLHTGIEVQILDSHGKAKVGKHDCGAIYDCLAPSANAVKKAGEWNRMTITAKANKINIVMNGKQIIDMDLNRWTKAHRNPDGSKNKFRTAYKDMPRRGHIGFQDHGRPVWYRNVRIKTLD